MSRAGQSKPSPTKWPVATTSSGEADSDGLSRPIAAARCLAPMPPLRTTRVQPLLAECPGEVVDVAGSLGEDEAVPTATEGI